MAAINDNLKEQFQRLQDLQQKKLARRKQRKDESASNTNSSASKSDTAASIAFGVDDDMGLQLEDPPPPSESIYSEELVQHLNDQLRELKDETGRLYKLLSERDLELRQLRKKREEDKTLLLSGSGKVTNENAATKIVELSKKVRELNAELQSEKTKSRQHAKKALDLENELHSLLQGSPTKKDGLTARSSQDGPGLTNEDIKSLQDKLKHSEMKSAEFRNQCQSLRQELKLAQKVITQECGEGATFQSLLNSSSGWRGRAQQIITLQKKVNELKSQDRQQQSLMTDDFDLEAEMMGSAVSRKTNADERHREQIRRMEKDRKEANEKMASEFKALEADHEALKQKAEASKARNKVLSTEVKSLKQQMQTLLDKGKHDDELIAALLKQQNQLKLSLEESMKKEKQREEKQEAAIKQLSCKTQQENNVVEQLHAIVAEKEAMVHSLEEEIKQMRLANLQKAQINGLNAMFEAAGSRPSTALSSVSSQLTAVSATCNIMEEVTSLPPSARAESRSVSRTEGDLSDRSTARKHSARGSSAGRDRQALSELQVQCQEYKSLCQAAQVERDKLSELVQVLQQRIESMTASTAESQSELVSQRRRNAELEKQLGKAKVEQVHSARKPGKGKSALRASTTGDVLSREEAGYSEMNLEELQTNLAIQRDENEALKAALQSTLQAKQEDLKLYNDMIDETKRVFLQGLRQYRQGAQA